MKICLSCGSEFVTTETPSRLATGRGKYCSKACSARSQKTSHGMWNTPEYRSWNHMRQRCNNPNNKKYYLYGARGITVCKEWDTFEQFYCDMGPRPQGTSIDRINPLKGYSPDNCRWATPYEQQNHVSNVGLYMFRGKMMTLTDISRETGVPKATLVYRVKQKWPDELVASPPSGRSFKSRSALQAKTSFVGPPAG